MVGPRHALRGLPWAPRLPEWLPWDLLPSEPAGASARRLVWPPPHGPLPLGCWGAGLGWRPLGGWASACVAAPGVLWRFCWWGQAPRSQEHFGVKRDQAFLLAQQLPQRRLLTAVTHPPTCPSITHHLCHSLTHPSIIHHPPSTIHTPIHYSLIHLPIHPPSTYLSTTHPPTIPTTHHPSTHLSTTHHPPVHYSLIHLPIHPPSIHILTLPPATHPPIHPSSICPSVHSKNKDWQVDPASDVTRPMGLRGAQEAALPKPG